MKTMGNKNMTWPEIPTLIDEKHYIESRFETVYPFIIKKNERIFLLPNDVKMHVVTLYCRDPSNNCLVMEYTDPGQEVFGEDGDCFYREDYETPDALFQDMLKETKN